MTPIRQRLVALAEGFAGVSVSTARQRYLDLVAPGDPRPEYFAHPKTSGCALVVRGLWRLAGLDHPILAAPYRIGRAIADVVEIAQAADAWIGAHELGARRPLPGDMVLVGAPSHEHVYTVVEAGRCGLTSIDGGQLDPKGQQLIARRGRTWSAGHPLIDTVAGGRARPVVGIVDVDRLPWSAALPRAAGCDLPGA